MQVPIARPECNARIQGQNARPKCKAKMQGQNEGQNIKQEKKVPLKRTLLSKTKTRKIPNGLLCT